jgi:hypothetical protein
VKKLLLLIIIPFLSFGQQIYVPDDAFEQSLIDQGYDYVFNNTALNSLIIDASNIMDFTGIEGFTRF